MSRAPHAKLRTEVDEYIASWHATMQLLREGKSFSGREPNCVFLNCGNAQFANISVVSGLDFSDDGRAVASVDWDHDGDLDLWIQNRTGPRLRFMRNQAHDPSSDSFPDPPANFIAVRLQGVHCNRDAIGARVAVQRRSDAESPPRSSREALVQTVYAGDGYLSQSSKWLHFGLGDDADVAMISVRWPDGQQEEFSYVQAGHRYRLVQGTGVAARVVDRGKISLKGQPQRVTDSATTVRAIFANPVPLPTFEMDASPDQNIAETIEAKQRPLLILFWASWCPNCCEELTLLTAQQPQLKAAKLDVLALNIDSLATTTSDIKSDTASENRTAADDVLRRTKFPYPFGYATAELMDKLQIVQRIVLNRPLESAVPTMLLVNRHNELTGIYQGVHSVAILLDDAKQSDTSIAKRRDLSIPYPGTWTTPPDVLLMRPVANVFREAGYRSDYERFLEIDRQRLARLRSNTISEQQRRELAVRFANDSLDIALSLLESGRADESLDYFREGLERVPDSARGHFHLGRAFQSLGQQNFALDEFRKTLRFDPAYYQASFQLGILTAAANQLSEAVDHFQNVVDARPGHVGGWTNLGVVLARMKRSDESINALQKATQLDPNGIQAWLALGGQLANRGDFLEASKCFRRVTELKPDFARGFAALGQTLVKLDDDVNASIILQRAIKLNQRDAGSRLQLAWLQSTSPIDAVRDGPAAVKVATELAKQTGNRDPRILDVLGAAQAEVGDFDRAAWTTQMAIDLMPTEHPLRRTLQGRIDRYKKKQPFRTSVSVGAD